MDVHLILTSFDEKNVNYRRALISCNKVYGCAFLDIFAYILYRWSLDAKRLPINIQSLVSFIFG